MKSVNSYFRKSLSLQKVGLGLLVLGLSSFDVTAKAVSQFSFGAYTSVQINVNAAGQNITGDAANEPSIAVNPINPNNIVITWKQFNSVLSSDRETGWSFTKNGGTNWKQPNLLTPGTDRTNGVLDVDSEGDFYYQGLTYAADLVSAENIQVFKSTDGGASWLGPIFAYGLVADKGWMTIDRSGGKGDGNIYIDWREGSDPNHFTRSIDQGASFQATDPLPGNPTFGTMKVGPNGELYVVGRTEPGVIDSTFTKDILSPFKLDISLNANDSAVQPSFSNQALNMGGDAILFLTRENPNQYGPIGDAQVNVDSSNGAMRGNIYVLAPVQTTGSTDPQDINFIRSIDGGKTWSNPLRINDDPPGPNAWQWFAMLGVAPNSRIDAVWYDTRKSQNYGVSTLYYAYSWDGGQTWSKNVPVSLPFNTLIGYPAGSIKIGDYSTLVSGINGASLAYTATFNNEQDVYQLNVFPDCNSNKQSDVLDITDGYSQDVNADHIPDECMIKAILGDLNGDAVVDQADLSIVMAAKNTPAAVGFDPRDLNHDGVINALDARKLTLLCTNPGCASPPGFL